MKRSFKSAVLLVVAGLSFALTGCNKFDFFKHHKGDSYFMDSNDEFRKRYPELDKQNTQELMKVRAATERYRNIENALKDGYADIAVDVQNMGHHYMRATIVDASFDMTKPEILVYNKDHNGKLQLVAVEYAVPLDLSATAPEGFSGTADVWDRNTGFGLWLLHAWVWHFNPEGVFNPTNSLIHLH